MKRKLLIALIVLLMSLTACEPGIPEPVEAPRNVILLIGDGMGPAQVKAYRMYADDPSSELVDPLPMEKYQVGSVSTDSIRLDCSEQNKTGCFHDPYGFTDSASSGTAYATGHDTVVGRLSVTPGGENLLTILQAARMRGKSTGLVATSQITHATPAAFGAHVDDREQHADIADQFFDIQWNGTPMIDVLLGGGLMYLQRTDRDLLAEFRQAGYEVALNRQELLQMRGDHLLGLFSPEGLPRAWDRQEEIPSLAEMTATALRTLERNPQGFFLLVEGSQVDWASHDRSVVGVISEMEDFIAAIHVALEFAQQNGDTLLVITADHETGGMSLGRDDIYRWDPRPLRGVKLTPEGMISVFLSGEKPLSEVLAGNVPFALSAAEIETLEAAERTESAARGAITELFNQRTFTGWSSPGHTGIDVPLYVFGPGSDRFHGVMQNEKIGQTLWDVFLPAD